MRKKVTAKVRKRADPLYQVAKDHAEGNAEEYGCRDEKCIQIEIFYTKEGLQFEDYSYEAEEKLETRNIIFLIACMMHDFLDEVTDQEEIDEDPS